MRYRVTGAAIISVGALLLAGCSTAQSTPVDVPPAPDLSTSADALATPDVSASAPLPTPEAPKRGSGSAAQALAALPVKGRAPKTGYSRAAFGQAWTDVDRNGCDTRTDILKRDLVDIRSSGACTITAGTLHDPYTGTTVRYVRGGASEVDIDHVVALSNAWQTGADRFPYPKRVALANDPLNLLAVDSGANRQKGDGDAVTWMVSVAGFRCQYVGRQIAVKTKYRLWVTAPEAAAMTNILSTCPGQPLPEPGTQPTEAPTTGPAPAPAPATTSGSGNSGNGIYYRTCALAKAAGVTPLRKGTPAYAANTHLDRDRDGVACE